MAYKFKKPVETYLSHITPDILKEIYENHGFEVELKKEIYHDQIFLDKGEEISDFFNLNYVDVLQDTLLDIVPVFNDISLQKKNDFINLDMSSHYAKFSSPYKTNKKSKTFIEIDKKQVTSNPYVGFEVIGG